MAIDTDLIYGGLRGSDFHFYARFATIQEMLEDFAKNALSTVPYGGYCIVEYTNKNNASNGSVFRHNSKINNYTNILNSYSNYLKTQLNSNFDKTADVYEPFSIPTRHKNESGEYDETEEELNERLKIYLKYIQAEKYKWEVDEEEYQIPGYCGNITGAAGAGGLFDLYEWNASIAADPGYYLISEKEQTFDTTETNQSLVPGKDGNTFHDNISLKEYFYYSNTDNLGWTKAKIQIPYAYFDASAEGIDPYNEEGDYDANTASVSITSKDHPFYYPYLFKIPRGVHGISVTGVNLTDKGVLSFTRTSYENKKDGEPITDTLSQTIKWINKFEMDKNGSWTMTYNNETSNNGTLLYINGINMDSDGNLSYKYNDGTSGDVFGSIPIIKDFTVDATGGWKLDLSDGRTIQSDDNHPVMHLPFILKLEGDSTTKTLYYSRTGELDNWIEAGSFDLTVKSGVSHISYNNHTINISQSTDPTVLNIKLDDLGYLNSLNYEKNQLTYTTSTGTTESWDITTGSLTDKTYKLTIGDNSVYIPQIINEDNKYKIQIYNDTGDTKYQLDNIRVTENGLTQTIVEDNIIDTKYGVDFKITPTDSDWTKLNMSFRTISSTADVTFTLPSSITFI